MMRAKARVNERDLLRLWIVHSELSATRFKGEQDCRRVGRTFFTERGIFARPDSGGNPDSPLPIEHRIVDVGLAMPDGFVPPIWRRRRDLVICTRWRIRITHRHFHLARRGTHWVEHWQIVNAEFSSSVN